MSEGEYPTGEGSADYSGAKIVRADGAARKTERDGHVSISFHGDGNAKDPHKPDAIHAVAAQYKEAEEKKKLTVREKIARAWNSLRKPPLSDREYLAQLPRQGVATPDQVVSNINDEADRRTAEAYTNRAKARAEISDRRYDGVVDVKNTLTPLPPRNGDLKSQN